MQGTGPSEEIKSGDGTMTTATLNQELKDFIDGQLCLIYECGENRDDICDNINEKARGLDESTRNAFYDYRDERESVYVR